jgi:ABC-type multidrug transport system ATPase subunit
MAQLAYLEDVGKAFGHTTALDGLTLGVPEGSVCGLLGPNGSGKTTAIRALLGLTRLDSGRAELLGSVPGSRGFRAAVASTGSLLEGSALYGRGTARDNLRIAAATRRVALDGREIERLLTLVGLGDRSRERTSGFSLGMKQRLGIAVALVGRPRLVILDEPTNGLDPAGIVEIRELIRALPASGATVLVSSHLLSEVQEMCDRVAIVHRGRTVADGTLAEVTGSATSGWRVRVAPEEVEPACRALEEVGLGHRASTDGSIEVVGPVEDGSQLSCLLAGSGIFVAELVQLGPTLEGAFLRLTGEGVESREG